MNNDKERLLFKISSYSYHLSWSATYPCGLCQVVGYKEFPCYEECSLLLRNYRKLNETKME